MKNILVVEDEENISKLIEDTLNLGNYKVETSFDGLDALNKINSNHYDLIILDIMLPNLNGFEIIEKMEKTNIPIIFLSALNDINTVVRGLKSGIDYMTKPFEPLELLARVDLRINKSDNEYVYKDITLNNITKEVYKNNELIALSKKEYDLFLLFLDNINKVISKEEILNKVWDIYAEVETRTIDYHIGNLRKKLDLKNDLITIHSIGYRLKSDNL